MDASVLQQARWWSWRRQRLDRTCRGVEDCLHSVIGVYSSNPQGPLSLLTRVPRLLKGAAVEGVISTKRAVRIPAMRRSIYLVPTENADRVFAATRLSDAPYENLMKRGGLSDKQVENLAAKILEIAAARPVTAEEIRGALPRPPKILTEVLQYLCAQGVLLRIKSRSIRSNDLTYAATTAWLDRPFERLDQAQALAWLAGQYLSAFGPISVEDFAWWTGHPVGAAREALAAHDTIGVGDGLLLHARDERAFAGMRVMSGRVNLLPKWDCYTMGYAEPSRARFIDPALREQVYDRGGNAGPVVLVEGEVQGRWSIRFSRATARIALEMFDAPGPKLRTRLEEEANLIGSFLEADKVNYSLERARRTPKPKAKAKVKPKPKPKAKVKRARGN